MRYVLFHFETCEELACGHFSQDVAEAKNRSLRESKSQARWIHPEAIDPTFIEEMSTLIAMANGGDK